MNISCDIGTPTVQKLRICVDMMVALNVEFLKRVKSSKRIPPLYVSGVRYRRESPPVTGERVERFALIPVVLQLRFGDCEDLAAWRVAELRMQGERATPWIIRPHPRMFHVQVRRGNGVIEDPSKQLGMRGKA